MKKALWFLVIIAAALGVYWFFFRKENAAAEAGAGSAGSSVPKFEIATPGIDVVNRTREDIINGRLNATVTSAASIVQSPNIQNNIVVTHLNTNAFN